MPFSKSISVPSILSLGMALLSVRIGHAWRQAVELLLCANSRSDRQNQIVGSPAHIILLLRRRSEAHRTFMIGIGGIVIDARFDDMTEMADEALNRPCGGIAQRANRVALDLIGYIEKHIDLPLLRTAFGHAGENAPHPAGTLAAGRTLATRLLLVKSRHS